MNLNNQLNWLMGIIFAIIFTLFYLIFFYIFIIFMQDEDVRTNVHTTGPGVYSRIITNAIGSVDEHCGEFILDKAETTPNGIQETGHIGNKNKLCYFSYTYLSLPSYIVGLPPVMVAKLVNCPDWGKCPKTMGANGYVAGLIIFIGQLFIYTKVGFILGLGLTIILKKIFSK